MIGWSSSVICLYSIDSFWSKFSFAEMSFNESFKRCDAFECLAESLKKEADTAELFD